MATEAPNPISFPEIQSEKLMDIFLGMTASILIDGEDFMMKRYGVSLRSNPSLARLIDRFSERWDCEGAEQLRQGAVFVEEALGNRLPKVNRRIARVFEQESTGYFEQLRDTIGILGLKINSVAYGDLIEAEKLVVSDWKLSNVLQAYIDENAPLFEMLYNRGFPFMWGGLIVYELKRRAFTARELKKTLGKV